MDLDEATMLYAELLTKLERFNVKPYSQKDGDENWTWVLCQDCGNDLFPMDEANTEHLLAEVFRQAVIHTCAKVE